MKRPKPSCPVGLLQHGETSPTFLLPPPGPASGPSPHSTSSINSFVSLSFGIPPTPCPSTLLPLLSRPFRCNLLGCRRHRTTQTLSLPTPPSVYGLAAHFLPLPCAVPSRLCTNVACTVPPRTPHPTLRVRPFGSVPLSFRVRPPRALSPSLRARPCHAPPPSLRAPLNRYLPFPFINPTRWILLHGSFPSYPSDRACCPITCTAALPRPCPPLSCGPTVHSPLILVRRALPSPPRAWPRLVLAPPVCARSGRPLPRPSRPRPAPFLSFRARPHRAPTRPFQPRRVRPSSCYGRVRLALLRPSLTRPPPCMSPPVPAPTILPTSFRALPRHAFPHLFPARPCCIPPPPVPAPPRNRPGSVRGPATPFPGRLMRFPGTTHIPLYSARAPTAHFPAHSGPTREIRIHGARAGRTPALVAVGFVFDLSARDWW